MYSRRQFLKTGTTAAAISLLLRTSLHASIATLASSAADSLDGAQSQRLTSGWEYLQGTMGGPWEVWHSKETAVWQAVAMPHCFNAYDACDPDVPYYQGNGWYRTQVAIANPYKAGRTLLHFEGAGQTAAVYVGEHLAGKHRGGYDEFVIDITDLITTSKDETSDATNKAKAPEGIPIAVLCDNSRDLDRIPSDLSDFSLYGGLYRHVNLVYVPAVSLETVHVRSELITPDSPAKVSVLGWLYNPTNSTGPLEITVDVVDAKGTSVHHAQYKLSPWKDAKELTSFTVNAPERWSPSLPHLYQCNITVSGQGGSYVAKEAFGIRHTEFVEHGPFKLNGERLLLRGTHRHEDHAGYAAAMPDDLIDQEMQLIKDMGVNFIRLAHYQQSRRVLSNCDRLGILVWEEVPWCRGGVGNDAFKEMTRDKLRTMIAQHYNHPSILLWGLGNEDDWPTEYPEVNQEKIRALFQELNSLAHELDPSRFTTIRRCDFARDITDVYSPSIWAGWYRGEYTEYQKILEAERERVNHFFHAEWGADSHGRRHSEDPDKVLAKILTGNGTDERGLDYFMTGGQSGISKDGDWSETYACNLFDWYLKTQDTLPWLTGSAQWIFKDFTTPLRAENPVPRINQKGVIERDMAKKEGYYVFQSYWSETPMVHLYGHSWPIRWGDEGELKMVKVYSNCDTAELFVNGKSAGVKYRDSQDFPAAGLRWMTPFVSGKNNLRVIATKGNITVKDEIDVSYQVEKWGKPAKLALTETGREIMGGKEIITVEGRLYDANGILCLDAKDLVHFTAAGDGTLIDNRGTSRGSRAVQMYNGRAQISLSCTGKTTIGIVSQGIEAAFYTPDMPKQ
ncbi:MULTISPECIES: glycoside hydrolase family 2 TIM barrel-domain containing protein [Acidobacteriaceae]|uniref:glycoside hydrolase family 2 protein n=1 Tax=Acidobacteriaceae TaxID=204434 RepID=UPI00131A66CF|nr:MULTISPECIES: glycoside hydrolase family 2 TIM barrel-domain containing protein [Acidobacteriaceae]MDW5265084.1 glycoside hydrolase family 2 TIM barrel-domain containing protein [Edaphobacter sp.]